MFRRYSYRTKPYRLIALLIVIASLLACPVWAGLSDPIPAESHVVAFFRTSHLLDKGNFALAGPEVREAVNEMREWGIQPENIEYVVGFITLNMNLLHLSQSRTSSSASIDGGLLAKGSGLEPAFLEFVRTHRWLSKSGPSSGLLSWGSSDYFVNPVDGEAVAVLDGYGVAGAVTERRLLSILNTDNGAKDGIVVDDLLQELSSRFKDDPAMVAAVYYRCPPESRDIAYVMQTFSKAALEMADLGPLSSMLDMAGETEKIGILITRLRDGLALELSLVMDTEESASFISGLLQISTGLLGFAQQNDPSTQIMKSLRVSRNGATIILDLSMTNDQLGYLLR